MQRALLIFTKNPVKGTVKTRIGRDKGDDVALSIYETLLRYTRDITSQVDAHKYVFFNRHLEPKGIWESDHFTQKMQVEGDLGIKMATAINEIFSEGAEEVIIIGSDCAELTSDEIEKAFNSLSSCDIVIGPAEDGGYYLLGMKQFHQELFIDMPWSEPELQQETLDMIEKLGLSSEILPIKSDIDFWEDWLKLGWELTPLP